MTYFAECFAWCMVQVTVFVTIAATIYCLAQRQRTGLKMSLITGSLAIVAALTILTVSPWPSWKLPQQRIAINLAPFAQTPIPHAAEQVPADVVDSTTIAVALAPAPNATPEIRQLPTPTKQHAWWLVVVLIAWLAAAIGTARLLVGYHYLRRYRRNSAPIEDLALHAEFDQLRQSTGATARVALRESSLLHVAATLGWRHPVILLPADWPTWSPNERRAVLAHELAHVAQRHFPMWVAAQAAIVTHFYHPLVHWLGRRLRFEQELADDEWAAEAFGSRRRYVDALAGLALRPLQPAGSFAGLGLFMSRPLLMRRIAMLTRQSSPPRRSRLVGGGVALLLALAAIAVAGLRASPRVDAAENHITTETLTIEANTATITAPTPATAAKLSNPTSDAPYAVTALIQVSRQPIALSAGAANSMTDDSWKTYCATQVELLKSNLVLQAAVREPAVAKLPILADQEFPAEWLFQYLYVNFLPGSEIIAVDMAATKENSNQVKAIVDAVVRAYQKEIVARDQQYQMAARDALAKSVSRMSDEITTKMEAHNALAKELGVADRGSGQVLQQLDLKRLERVEDELMRLQDASLRDEVRVSSEYKRTPEEVVDSEFHKRRIEQLAKIQTELQEKIVARSERSVDLTVKSQELEQLQQIARDMSIKLESMDLEAAAPSRIRVIQPATVSRP